MTLRRAYNVPMFPMCTCGHSSAFHGPLTDQPCSLGDCTCPEFEPTPEDAA
jgi:hypothetical protein